MYGVGGGGGGVVGRKNMNGWLITSLKAKGSFVGV